MDGAIEIRSRTYGSTSLNLTVRVSTAVTTIGIFHVLAVIADVSFHITYASKRHPDVSFHITYASKRHPDVSFHITYAAGASENDSHF